MNRYRVFLSHAWADLWVAQQIERRMRALGAETFIDVYDVKAGDVIEDWVFETIPTCREFVVLFTPWSMHRNWLWIELGVARGFKLRVVPILYGTTLDEIDRTGGGATFLRAPVFVDINRMEDYLSDLAIRVRGE